MNRGIRIRGLQNKQSLIQEDSDESTGSINLEQKADKLINFNKGPQGKGYRFRYLNRVQDVEFPRLRKSIISRAYQHFGSSTPFVSLQRNNFFPEDSLNLSGINTDSDEKSDKIGRNNVNNKKFNVPSSEESSKETERNKFSCKQSTRRKHKMIVKSNLYKGNSIKLSLRRNKKNIGKNSRHRADNTYLQTEKEENKIVDISDNSHSSIRKINCSQGANKRNVAKLKKSRKKDNTKVLHTNDKNRLDTIINDFCTENTKIKKYKSRTISDKTRSKINESQDRITKGSSNNTTQISHIQNIDNANFSKALDARTSKKLKGINDITQQNSSSSQIKTIRVHNNRLLRSAKKAFLTDVSKHNVNEMNENEVQQTNSSDISNQLLDEFDQLPIFDGINRKGFITPKNEIRHSLIQSENKTETIAENSEKIHKLNAIIAQLSAKKSNDSHKESVGSVSRTSTVSHSSILQNSRILVNKEIQTSVKKSNGNHHLNKTFKRVYNSQDGDEVDSKNKVCGYDLLFVSLAEDKSIGFSRDEHLYISNNQSLPWRLCIDPLRTNSLRRSNIQVPFLKRKIEVERSARHDLTLCEPSDREFPKKVLKQYENRQKTDEREHFVSEKILTLSNEKEDIVDEFDSDDLVLNEPKKKIKPYSKDTKSSKNDIKPFKKNGKMVENKKCKKQLFYYKKRLNKNSKSNKFTENKLNEDNVELIETPKFGTRNKTVLESLDTESINTELDEKKSRNYGQLQHSYIIPADKKVITRGEIRKLQNSARLELSCGKVSSGSEVGRSKRERRPVPNKYGMGYVIFENERALKAFTSSRYAPKKAPRRTKTLQKSINSTKETAKPYTSNADKQSKVPVKMSTAKRRGKPIPKSLSFCED